MTEQIQNMIEQQEEPFGLPNDPGTRFTKFIGVPKGVTAIISVQGTRDILEIINPDDGRLPFFRLREELRVSENIELSTDEEEDYDNPSDL
jgi:hypothetical protein